MAQDSIVSRIQKLHALAQKAGTEAEAAAAAARVAELCRKHNLELGSVLIQQQETKASKAMKEHDGVFEAHRSALIRACESLFDVGAYITRYRNVGVSEFRNAHSIVFYGLKANVESATMTYSYFSESVEAMLWAAVKAKSGVFGRPKFGRRETRSWRMGCANRVYHEALALKKAIEGQVAADGETQAIILIGNKLKEEFRAAMKLKAGGATLRAQDSEAYSAGYAAGGSVDLHGARSNRMLKGGR